MTLRYCFSILDQNAYRITRDKVEKQVKPMMISVLSHTSWLKSMYQRIACALCCCMSVGICTTTTSAQSHVGERPSLETRTIVTRPTAGILARRALAADLGMLPHGAVELSLSYAPLVNVELGLHMYGTGVVGSGDIAFPDVPSIRLAWRVFDETSSVPAIALGVNTIGEFPQPSSSISPFALPGPGAYIAASKHYLMLGTLDLHAGVGYVFAWPGTREGVNIWAGAEKSLGAHFSITAEVQYMSSGVVPNSDGIIGSAGLLAYLGRGLTIELQAADLFSTIADAPERRLQLYYVSFL